MKYKNGCILLAMFLIFVLFGCNQETEKATNDSENNDQSLNEDKEEVEEAIGNELNIAIATSPPTLDPPLGAASVTRDIGKQVFETLVTINSEYEVMPMLADSWDISDDGKTYTFYLREGIQFHNGKEMTAEDVVPSMQRWIELTPRAKSLLGDAVFEEVDEYTIVLKLNNPSVFVLTALAMDLGFPAIMPKEIIEEGSEQGVQEYIGTGPYEYADWRQDQYIHLKKYEDYQPVDFLADGTAGRKEALVENLYFHIVQDPSTRLSGLLTGQYDIGLDFDQEEQEQLRNASDINVNISYAGYPALVFNRYEGLFTDINMRRAVNAALDIEEIAAGSLADGYRLGPSYMQKEQVNWYSEAGSELYNQPDIEEAKALLEEAGYQGETIRLLATRDYNYMYNSAVIIQEQLSKIGMNIEIDIYDWGTVLERRQDSGTWELYMNGAGDTLTPLEKLFLNDGYYGGSIDDDSKRMVENIKNAESIEEAKKVWDDLQQYLWESLPLIKTADKVTLSGISNQVKGLEYFNGYNYWNTTIEE